MILPSEQILESLSKEEREALLSCSNFSELKNRYKQHNITSCSPAQFWREQQTIELVSQCHFPISSQLQKFVHDARMIDQGESKPQFYFALCSLSSLLLRYIASISIQLYVDLTNAAAMDFNTKMVKIIEKATDGQWQNITKDVLEYIHKSKPATKTSWREEKPQLMEVFDVLYSVFHSSDTFIEKDEIEEHHLYKLNRQEKRSDIKNVSDLLSYLVYFRNKLIHAEAIPEQRYKGTCIALFSVITALKDLWKYQLCVQVDNQLWDLSRVIPKKREEKILESNRQICLTKENKHILTLSPLLCISQNITSEEDIEDIFFINVGILNNLNYLGFQKAEHKAGKTLGTYEQFKKYMSNIPTPPMSKEDRYNFEDYAFDKAKHFVGRQDVLGQIEQKIKDPTCSYIELRALAGMGKTAIMANLYQKYDKGFPNDLCWAFHFCMNTDGRNTSIRAFRSIISILGEKLNINGYKKRSLSWELKELKERFEVLLNGEALKKQLTKNKCTRLVIAIDALDEGFGGEEGIVDFISQHLNEHVVFLYSYRVNQKNENRRVQNILQNLPQEKRHVLDAANPLKGLTKEDVGTFLTKIQNTPIPEKTYNQVWTAASQDLDNQYADPFYLRFVLDGVLQKRVFLNRAETIPSSLDDAFEDKWLSLPKNFNFLGHRLLLTLAIMRDHGDDELFVELFNRNKRSPKDEDLSINDIAQTRLSIGKLLIYDEDRYTLFHDRFRYFLVGEQKDPIAEALGITGN